MGGNFVIGTDNIYEVLTYFYKSYSMHNNMISHTGCWMELGWG